MRDQRHRRTVLQEGKERPHAVPIPFPLQGYLSVHDPGGTKQPFHLVGNALHAPGKLPAPGASGAVIPQDLFDRAVRPLLLIPGRGRLLSHNDGGKAEKGVGKRLFILLLSHSDLFVKPSHAPPPPIRW